MRLCLGLDMTARGGAGGGGGSSPAEFAAGAVSGAANAATLTLAMPAGVQNGDTLVAFIWSVEVTDAPHTTPSGYTLEGYAVVDGGVGVANDGKITVFSKTAGASEGSLTVTAFGESLGFVVGVRNVTGVDQFLITSNSTATTSLSVTGVTTTQDDAPILQVLGLPDAVTISSVANTDLTLSELTSFSGAAPGTGNDWELVAYTAFAGAAGLIANTTATSSESERQLHATISFGI